MKRAGSYLGLTLAALVLASCSPKDEGSQWVGEPGAAIVLFNVTPSSVKAGDPVSLSWMAVNALELNLTANGEAIGDPIPAGDSRLEQGSATFTPSVTTVFRLEVKGGDEEIAFEEVEVQVIPYLAAAIDEFRAEPAQIPTGSSSMLQWKTTNAASIQISDAQGNSLDLTGKSAEAGAISVTPSVTTTYTLFADGVDGDAESSVAVTVLAAPILSLVADPLTIAIGESSTLSWITEGATSVTVKEGDTFLYTTEEDLSGSFVVSPSQTTVYTVEAMGEGGLTAATAEVGVQPRIDTFLSDTLGQIRVGMLVDLSWTTTGASRLVLANESGFSVVITGDEVASGRRKAPVGTSGLFLLTAQSGDLETVSTFGFNLIDRPVILDLRVVSGPQTAGPDVPAEVVVRWDVTDARSLSLLAIPGGEISLAGKSVDSDEVTVSIFGPTTFELTAENPVTSVSSQVLAEVVEIPAIELFRALPSRVGQGESTTISWEVGAAERIELTRDGLPIEGVGPQDFSGSISEQLVADTHYRLRAFNSLDYEVVDEFTVGVGTPVIVDFAANRGWHPIGGEVVLSWRAEGGTSLELTGPGGATLYTTEDLSEISGHSISIQAPTDVGPANYVLTLTNGAGPETRTIQVEITDGPVIEFFEVSPERISTGESLHFSWQVMTDADGDTPALTLVDSLGTAYDLSKQDPLAGSASFEMAVAGSYTFTLEARTSGTRFSTAEASAQVLLRPELILAQANPEFASNEREPIILEWQTHNADRLSLYPIGDDGLVKGDAFYTTIQDVAAGTTTFEPTIEAPHVRFVLESDLGSRLEEDLRIGVGPATIVSFKAEPDEIFRGETTKLSWETTRATSVEIQTAPYIETDEEYIDLSQRSTATQLLFSPSPSVTGLLKFPGGFTFPFDGADRKDLRVANSGYVSFDVKQETGSMFVVSLPSDSRNYIHLAPFLGDLDRAASNGEIWWELIDDNGEDGPHLVIQFKNMSVDDNTTALLNYQIVMWSEGSFDFRYGSMVNAPNQDIADGLGAVIGYQNARGTVGHMLVDRLPFPGGLSNRTFHFPVINRPMEITSTAEPFLDISGSLGAIEWTSRTENPQFFNSMLVESFPDGFVFPFAGEDRRGIWIMRDGYAHFDLYDSNGNLKTSSSSRSGNVAMGVGSGILGGSSDVHLAPFWNYLVNNYGTTPGTIWTALREDGKGRFFVIQWKGFSSSDSALNQNSKLNFQILLREDGSFEYRYGNMEAGSNSRNADGSLSTIGFQEPNGIRGATVTFNAPVLGGLTGKAWTFVPEPPLPLSGELELRPRGGVDYTLVARNGHSYHEVSQRVGSYAHSALALSTTPEAPRPGQTFSIDWHAAGITSLTIEDEEGTIVHQVQGTTFDLRQGTFPLLAGLEMGVHLFTIRGQGYLGDSVVEVMEILVFPPFSIDEFTSSAPTIRSDEKVRLSWLTTDVGTLSLTSDVLGPIDISTLNMVSDSLELEPTQTTTYTLTATSDGRTTFRTVVVEVRTISIEEFESSGSESGNNVIRGAPVVVDWKTLGSGGIYWRSDNNNAGLPDEYFVHDVSDEAKFVDIEGTEGAERIGSSTSAGTVTVGIPFFFGLYGDETVGSIRVSSYGGISSRSGDSMSSTTTRFPDYSNVEYDSNRNGRIAIFWDNLHPDGVGKMHTKHIINHDGVDQFIIQWKDMKFNVSSSDRNGSLNFQLVLFEDQSFEFRYGKMSGTDDDTVAATESYALRALGSAASIGFRSAETFGIGQQISYRTPVANGGLSNRSLRFVRSTVPFVGDSLRLAPFHSTNYEVCAKSDTWSECESFRVVVPEPGHLMITELQIDPLGVEPIQWFEIRNLTLDPIDLEGMTLVIGSQTVPINTGRPLVLPPAAYGVFSAAASTSFDSFFIYGTGIDLKTETSIELRSADTVMARASWEPGWFLVRATSLSLDTSMQRVGTVGIPTLSSWCETKNESRFMYDEANLGTPGTHGETCSSGFYDVDYLSDRPFVDISETGVRMPEMVPRFQNQIVPLGNGFRFPFFNEVIQADQMWSGSWGTISFGPYRVGGGSAEDAVNLSTQVPGDSKRVSEFGLIAGPWADTQPRADGTTSYFAQRLLIDGFEVFIAQWNRYSRFYVQSRDGDLIGSSTHQIQIWENGDIVIAFDEIIGYRFNGTDATIGLVNPNGSEYLQYFFKQPLLVPHQSILYKRK